MNPLKHKMANEWMRQDDASPEEALDTWNAMEAEFKANRAMVQEPRTMAQEPRNMYQDGQLVQNTADGSRPGYDGKDKISFKDQLRTSGGTYKKMYSMEDIRKTGKELNVSEYNKDGIKLTSNEYRDVVNNSKSRFNFYKNKFESFSPKKKKEYIKDFNKQLVKHKEGGYYISSEKRMPNANFVKKYFPNATGGSKIVTSINGMLLKNFVNKGNVIKTSPKADANAIRIEELRKITNPTWETSTGVQGSGGQTLQHTASKNQMVKLNNLSYLEKKLNSSMSQNDKRIKIIENEVDRLLKTKPKNYVQRINALNTEGMALASGYIKKDGKIVKGSTAGYSEFRVKDPLNEKLSYFGKDESKMLLPDKDPNLIQKDSDLIGKNIKDMNADELKRAKQIAIDRQKEFKTAFSKTFQDLSPQSVLQMGREFNCLKKQEGGSIMRCLQTKFKADPEKFLQRSAPIAKGNPNLRKWLMRGRNIARGTGVFAAWEAALAPVLMGWMASEGESWDRMKHDLAWGPLWEAIGVSPKFVPGKSVGEEWMEAAGGDEGAYAIKRMGELQDQELPLLKQQLNAAINEYSNVPGRGQKIPQIEKLIKEKELEMQDLWNKSGFMEGPAGGAVGGDEYFNVPKIEEDYATAEAADAKVIADKKAKLEEYRKKGYVAQEDWMKNVGRRSDYAYASGGLTKTVAPDSEGIMSLKKKR